MVSFVGTTRLSSKGQVVVPSEMRSSYDVGDQFLIFTNGSSIILKPLKGMDAELLKELEYSEKVEKILQKFDKGLSRSLSAEEFQKELQKW